MNLLFIGNSFTARNDLPHLVGQLAQACGQSVQHSLIWAGGASLRMHWNKGDAQKAIQQTRYDYVVLQEQSTLAIKNPERMHENIRLFDSVIKASGAKTALYLTWARQNAPETQRLITDAYVAIGKMLDATLFPVGMAWERFLLTYPSLPLHDKDQSHPTPAGSYLAACVMLACLFDQNPTGVPGKVKGLLPEEIERLQKTAWGTVSSLPHVVP
ncbi:MAG: SGNH/GDSL hydrolase family protein [candidate division Zixibacteria bacterium]|nr:SGNH/GDSL hydrolase family protein [candidate division Zixibacteria bacterium]